jgi:hypothetical protein
VTPSLLDTCGTVWQWFLPFTISFKGKTSQLLSSWYLWQWFLPFTISFKGKNLSSWYLWHWFLPFTISFKGKTCK